jgi:ribosomal protein S12 methylthiotransferase
MKTQIPKLFVHTLGCSKNQVDSEVLVAQARANAFSISPDAENADILIINTCGFIEAAKQESIDHILQAVKLKDEGKLKKVMVMGCLSERYADDLRNEIPEVDAYYGTTHLPEILKDLGGNFKYDLIGERELSTPKHFAYLKISEGCDNPCSFCAIPLMRGGHKSKSLEDILIEAKALRAKGVRELILIGQDLTYYGLDAYGKRTLDDLLRRLSDLGFDWIRLLYAYPAKFPTEILPVMRERENICKYLDMPIQHTETEVLKHMRRGITQNKLRDLISQIRDEVPGIRMRTTLIVGYPTETKQNFDSMLGFLEEMKFDRLGVFPYSQEDDTVAFDLGDKITKKEKQRRVKAVMDLQENISLFKNMDLIGKTMPVLIDNVEGNVAYGRTEFDCPEVDNEVIIDAAKEGMSVSELQVGQFYQVEVGDVQPFDLFGTLVGNGK